MRDPNRLDDFYKEFSELHKTYLPDYRWGQLCSNFFGWVWGTYGKDFFFPEEKEMMELFKEYLATFTKYGKAGEDLSE